MNDNDKIVMFNEYMNILTKTNNNIYCLLCNSKAGYGKTYNVLNYLKSNNIKFHYNAGVTTSVSLYKLLYQNVDSVIVLDDIETLFNEDKSINILKSALWSADNSGRIITYKSSAKCLQNYPEEFVFNGKLIILANNIRNIKNVSVKALISRCLKFEFDYSIEQLKQISINILQHKFDNNAITKIEFDKCIDIMTKHVNDNLINSDYNFRLLDRIVMFTKHNINIAEQLYFGSILK